MKQLIYFPLFLFCCNLLFAQDSLDSKELYFKEFEWRIQVPKGFDTITKRYEDRIVAKGFKVVEEVANEKIEDNTQKLFLLRKGLLDYMQAIYQPFDPKKDGSYEKYCNASYDLTYKAFRQQMPDKKIDTVRGIEIIDHLKFHKFIVKINLDNERTLNCYLYSRLFGKKDLSINITYLTLMNGAIALSAVKNSTFSIKPKK